MSSFAPTHLPARMLCLQSAPSEPIITGITDQVLTWDPPSSDGGALVSQFTVTVKDFSSNVVGAYTVTCPASGCTAADREVQLTGLDPNSDYLVQVTATNAAGTSLAAVALINVGNLVRRVLGGGPPFALLGMRCSIAPCPLAQHMSTIPSGSRPAFKPQYAFWVPLQLACHGCNGACQPSWPTISSGPLPAETADCPQQRPNHPHGPGHF